MVENQCTCNCICDVPDDRNDDKSISPGSEDHLTVFVRVTPKLRSVGLSTNYQADVPEMSLAWAKSLATYQLKMRLWQRVS